MCDDFCFIVVVQLPSMIVQSYKERDVQMYSMYKCTYESMCLSWDEENHKQYARGYVCNDYRMYVVRWVSLCHSDVQYVPPSL